MAAVTHQTSQAAFSFPGKTRPCPPSLTSQPPGGQGPPAPTPQCYHLQGDGTSPPGDSLQQDTVSLACAEHEAEVPGLGDGQREALPGHQAAAQEALRVGHFWGGR